MYTKRLIFTNILNIFIYSLSEAPLLLATNKFYAKTTHGKTSEIRKRYGTRVIVWTAIQIRKWLCFWSLFFALFCFLTCILYCRFTMKVKHTSLVHIVNKPLRCVLEKYTIMYCHILLLVLGNRDLQTQRSSICLILMLSILGKIFSRRHIKIFFLFFPRKQVLTFHANCLVYPVETMWMKCQVLFSGKTRKISFCHLLNLPRESCKDQCSHNVDPLKPNFYIEKLGFTGVYIIFLIFAQKHRLWVLVRTASLRRF